MSSPPADPWSGQPEHGRTYGSYPPPHPGGHSAYPPPPGDRPAPPHGGIDPTLAGGWPAPYQQGGHPGPPAHGGSPAAQSHDPYATQPYGGHPAPQPGDPHATQLYGGFPSVQQGGFPAGQPYGAPVEPPGRKSRLGLVLSLVLAGLLVLCVGGGGLAYVALDGSDPVPTASPTPAARGSAAPTATAEPSPSEDDNPFGRTRLVTPKTLAGRSKSTDPQLRKVAEQTAAEMKSTVRNETSVVSAFYGSPAKRNMLMVVGASGLVLDPAKELDDAIDGLSTELSVTKMSRIDPGPLGGEARCGNGRSADVPLGVCVWADAGSVGMVVLFFSSGSRAKTQFARIRGQVEKRS